VKIAYFPLRSSVELFKDPASPEPVSRAKHAALLYDMVVFEAGLFEQRIGPDGGFSTQLAPEAATTQRREHARVVHEPDSGFQINIGVQPEVGVPASTMHPIISTTLEASYASEWHTGIIDELTVLKPDWAAPLQLSEQQLADFQPVIRELKQALAAVEPVGDMSPFHRNFVVDALSRDAVVAAVMGAAVQVTSLFEPFLPRLDMAPDHPGLLSLDVAVPGIEQLSWEEIAEFRDHAGSAEARARLRAAEEGVVAEGVDDREFAVRVGQEVTADLFAAMAELKGSLPKKLAKEGINAGLSLIPVVGTFASAISAAELVGESAGQSRTWHAALMKLRKAAERPS
jgi:hypothetical protein